MIPLYQDRLIEITDNQIAFHCYYFPFGKKRLAIDRIDRIEMRPSSLSTGSWRLWGTGDFRTWFPLDWRRPSRDKIFIAYLRDSSRQIGFTTENSTIAEHIFREKGLLRADQLD